VFKESRYDSDNNIRGKRFIWSLGGRAVFQVVNLGMVDDINSRGLFPFPSGRPEKMCEEMSYEEENWEGGEESEAVAPGFASVAHKSEVRA
jgi:hypothetical protein